MKSAKKMNILLMKKTVRYVPCSVCAESGLREALTRVAPYSYWYLSTMAFHPVKDTWAIHAHAHLFRADKTGLFQAAKELLWGVFVDLSSYLVIITRKSCVNKI